MKKSVLALALAFGVTTAFAQDLTSKKGEPFLPEAGDWGLGIDATPFLNYAGNFFGKSVANTAPTWDWITNNQTISGKYFADEKTAYRGAIRIGFGSTTTTKVVNDDANTSTTPAYKEDKMKHSTSGIGLSGGIEMRRGKTRLQGYYGGELGIFFGNVAGNNTYTYGNAITNTNPNPSTSNFGTNVLGGGARATTEKSGSTFGLGIRGFIGAEYFVLPKMSIGGEFGWGLAMTSTGAGSVTSEVSNGTGGVTTTTTPTGKNSSFSLDTDAYTTVFGKAAGTLRLNLYF